MMVQQTAASGAVRKTIRVVLADDHAMIRRGIRRMLEKDHDIEVVGEAQTGANAIHLVHKFQPDVLLLDIELPDMQGHHVARELREHNVRTSILALSTAAEGHFICEILQAGMDEYVNKSEAPVKLREAIHRVVQKKAGVRHIET